MLEFISNQNKCIQSQTNACSHPSLLPSQYNYPPIIIINNNISNNHDHIFTTLHRLTRRKDKEWKPQTKLKSISESNGSFES